MFSSIGGALLGVGGSLLGIPLQNYYNKKAQSQSNDYSIHMWNLANEYNLPKNQMQRLKDAGLNPNLAYGNMSTVSPAGSTARQAPDAQGAMNKVGESLMNYYTIQQMKKSNDKLDAEIAGIKAGIENQKVRTESEMWDLKKRISGDYGSDSGVVAKNVAPFKETVRNVGKAVSELNNTHMKRYTDSKGRDWLVGPNGSYPVYEYGDLPRYYNDRAINRKNGKINLFY